MADSGVFSDFLLASALSVQVGIAVPLGFHYSQHRRARTRLQNWFIWPAVLGTAVLSAYLIAGLDNRVFNQANVWDVFVITLALLVTLGLIILVQTGRPKQSEDANSREKVEPPAVPSLIKVEKSFEVCNSSSEYAQAILSIERHAVHIDRMAKRISAIFKDPSAVEAIAVKRFGPGSRQAEAYLWEHRERHRIFMENVGNGASICREIYQMEELRRYFTSRSHGLDVVLDRAILRRTAVEWLRVIASCPNYFVGLTSDPIPLKYQLFDQRTMVIHEAAGRMDGQRLSALIVRNEAAVADFQTDFEHVWERIPAEMRSRRKVVAWIKAELMPLISRGAP